MKVKREILTLKMKEKILISVRKKKQILETI
jgi:hypothetical protein